MNRFFSSAALLSAALVLAACGKADAAKSGGDSTPAAATAPAGRQPAPTAQDQAAPQHGSNTPPAADAEAPPPDLAARTKQTQLRPGDTYASCIAKVRGGSADERRLLEQSCASLPGAPKH